MAELVARADPRPSASWPTSTFDAPVLRGLDDRARREIADAGRLLSVDDGELVYRAGDGADSFYVVVRGAVAIRATRRGDADESDLRVVEAGDAFGEEAVVGARRPGAAAAQGSALLAEIPVHVFRRASKRASAAEGAEARGGDLADRLERTLRRSAARDLLKTSALGRDLAEADVDRLLDAVRWQRFERGEAIYRSGDEARELWIVADGLVQIQSEDGERLRVLAYLTSGDAFAEDVGIGRARTSTAIASGPSVLLAIGAATVHGLAERHPDLLARLRRTFADEHAAQRNVFERAANATQHLFRDVYRLDVARSLLVIDLETCVRCGHCAWTCADLHGVARLVRRGDKIVTREADGPGALPASLMLPNSCQHCENPACMKDCPTGAIGRGADGEVFIREALCTGCGACAKACPWDNIAMAARPPTAARPSGGAFPDLAVKCDLCREFERGPACVQACPTESIFRINPAEDVDDVRDVLGRRALDGRSSSANRAELRPPRPSARTGDAIVVGVAIGAIGVGVAGATLQGRGAIQPGHGLGLIAGAAAAIGFVVLLGYALVKRGARIWMRFKAGRTRAPVRSIVRPQATAHFAIGLATLGLVFVHAPWPVRDPSRVGVALELAFLASSFAGILTGLAYRLVPSRLARIERTAALPEDFSGSRRDLLDQLYRQMTGRSDLVKKITETSLLRYARSPFGWMRLVASGRSLADEERAIRARIDQALEGRGAERLAGLTELVRTVVELRALSAQRWLQRGLRVGLPAHVVTFGLALALLVLHLVAAAGAILR